MTDPLASEESFGAEKQRLLERWAKAGWLENPRLAEAFLSVPRTAFISSKLQPAAYRDEPLPIGYGQTISQPSTVIRMLSALDVRQGHNVLEIGAGCGYQAVLLAYLAGPSGKVHSVDIVQELVVMARQNWHRLQTIAAAGWGEGKMVKDIFAPIEFFAGDGSNLPGQGDNPISGQTDGDHRVYDRIIAACACPQIPYGWQQTVKVGGKILAPVGGRKNQRLVMATRVDGGHFETEELGYFRFVPLRGKYGFQDRN